MSRWVEMYPVAWRDRYGDEMEWLLSQRPPGPGDVVDLARGAVDAHMHPQVPGGSEPTPWTHRLPGALAALGGALWVTATIAAIDRPFEPAPIFGLALVLLVISVLGDYLHDVRVPLGRGITAAVALIAAVLLVGWPLLIPLTLALVLLLDTGLLALGAYRAGFDAARRWAIVLVAGVLPFLAFIVAAMGVTQDGWLWLAVLAIVSLFGVAWLIIGATMLRHGAPTLEAIDTDRGDDA